MSSLPILSVIPSLKEALNRRDEVILEAPPGAGKTTQVPLSLLDSPWLHNQKILMLEPRRLAAKNAAARMADLLNERVGETVGYRIRLEQKISTKTRIEIVTEGILTRLLQTDPSLEGYGLVIFDEFHERSLDADLGLALCQEARTVFRDEIPLKLLIMSATLDGHAIAQLLNDAPIIKSEGRSYPVSYIYAGKPKQGTWLEPHVVNILMDAITTQTGSILCFLPGVREIRQVEQRLTLALQTHALDHIIIAPLYGDLKLEQQQQAINPAPQGKRKVVLATSIAETSLTIEGVTVVVDSGLSREARYNPNTAMTTLFTRPVSKAAATQRAGRAGRLAPGLCYRLWSEPEQLQLSPFSPPDILQADLTGLALQLASWGINDSETLSWLDLPPTGAYQQAKALLAQLGAFSPNGSLSPHGERMASLPAHPRISHMLIRGAQIGLSEKACFIAALLMEKDPFRDVGADINIRLDWLKDKPTQHKGLWQRLHKQAKHYLTLCQPFATENNSDINPEQHAGLLLAFAYPDRVAKQRSKGSSTYKLSNGRAASLFGADNLASQPWLTVGIVIGKEGSSTDLIPLAAALNPEHIPLYLAESTSVNEIISWDSNRIVAEKQYRIGDVIISKAPLKSPSKEAIVNTTLAYIRKQGLQLLPWNSDVIQWRSRVIFLYRTFKENPTLQQRADQHWPNLTDEWLLENLEHWLAPFLNNIARLNDLKQLDLKSILLSLLPWPLPQQLDELAPERYRVPSGSNIRIDYSQTPPVLAVKLQEMFGCETTPTIAHHIALQLHLLSPARRPLQVTQDLSSFWQNAYRDVQKDMKGRYPKHPWPDNPLQALPTAKVKKKMT